MKKLTIREIESVVKSSCSAMIARIYELRHEMKVCREKIVRYKKDLELEAHWLKCYSDDYVNYVTGKSLQDPSLLNFTKIRLGDYEQAILESRKNIKTNVKKLQDLRKENQELFNWLVTCAVKKSTEIANDGTNRDKDKKIVLDRDQARTVFNKLYELFDSENDFKQVTIKIG